MSKINLFVLAIITILIPLDGFYVKWIGSADFLIIFFSQFPDLALLVLFILNIIWILVTGKKFKIIDGTTETLILIFISLSCVAAIYNQNSISNLIINLKALFRYFLIIYIVINSNISFKKIFSWVKLIIGIEIIIGLAQIFLSKTAREFFLPPSIDSISQLQSVSLIHLLKENAIFGTMDKSIEFALLMLVAIGFIFSFMHRSVKRLLLFGLCIALIYFSTSRSVLIGSFLLIFLIFHFKGSLSKTVYRSILIVPILIVGISIYLSFVNLDDNTFTFAFTERYWEIAKMQRLGTLITVFPAFFSSGVVHLLLGFGPDINVVNQYLQSIPNLPYLIDKTPGTIKDVYWIAFLYYYGLIGFIIFIVLLLNIGLIAKKSISKLYTNSPKRNFVLGLLGVGFFLSFFNQVFEIRTYSYFMWLIFAFLVKEVNDAKKKPVR